MPDKDYYKILGVPKSASKEEIKTAYKKLAKQFHPDINKEANATEKFKEINEAASVLADDAKREQYDQYGSDFERKYHQDFSRQYSGSDFEDMDFGDVFEMFFGGGFGSGSSGHRKSRGRDLRYDLDITLEEASSGIKKSITVEKPEVCEDCNGKGGEDYEKCSDCNGSGVKRVRQQTPFGIFESRVTCKKCQGHGEIIKDTCSACKGKGIVHKKKTIVVDIPAGVDSGSQLRLQEEGEAVKNGTTGDLYIFIDVKKHKYFEREGDDIILEIPISVTQAMLGDEVEVPTLEGKAMLKIPKGTQPDTTFRMKNKGIQHLNHSGQGDQLVKVKVEIPEKLTKKQEDLIKEFDKELGKKDHLSIDCLDKIYNSITNPIFMIDTYIKDERGYFIETSFVCRNFQIGDRAKIRFNDIWFHGEVVDKCFSDTCSHSIAPYIIVKTDTKVSQKTDKNDLLNGYGLRCRADGWDIIFENEKDGGNKMYHKIARRSMTPSEIEQYNEPLPF